MRIIRKSEQQTCVRAGEDRQVRTIFNGAAPWWDWLTVTHSKTCPGRAGASVSAHSHPNAVELILFLQSGTLVIKGTKYRFRSGDAVLLSPNEAHGAHHTGAHDCLCILLGRGEPRKTARDRRPAAK